MQRARNMLSSRAGRWCLVCMRCRLQRPYMRSSGPTVRPSSHTGTAQTDADTHLHPSDPRDVCHLAWPQEVNGGVEGVDLSRRMAAVREVRYNPTDFPRRFVGYLFSF